MAVPGRRNGLIDDDDDDDDVEEDNVLFQEDGIVELDEDYPPHLQALYSAARYGDVLALHSAIDDLEGIIDEPIEDGDTALHLTCLYGHSACVQLLLDKGANLEVQDEDGAIPLHDACAGGFIDIVQILLSRGAQTNCVKRMLETVDAEDDTPLHHAARGEHSNIVSCLLGHGASPAKKNIYGKTPSELAEAGTETRRLLEAALLTEGSQ